MTKPKKNFTDEFIEGVVQYTLDYPDESLVSVAKKFDIADSIIHVWRKQYLKNEGKINSRGSGNHASDEAKEIARLKKEPKDTQEAALDVLKKAIGILGK